jgi:membrane protein implicated in regulation of membrane protease activity
MVWNALLWWIGSAVLVGAEMVTGTFYLLAIAIAFASGGVVAWMDFSPAAQLTVAAVMSAIAVIVLRRWKARRTGVRLPANLDVGHPVQVTAWQDDGTARVSYRGAQWDAELQNADTPRNPTLYIAEVRGSVLILSDRRPNN